MSEAIKAILIGAMGLIVAAVLNGGIYQIVATGAGSGGSQDISGDTTIWAYRLSRFTGDVVPFLQNAPLPLRQTKPSK